LFIHPFVIILLAVMQTTASNKPNPNADKRGQGVPEDEKQEADNGNKTP
jgi:hypothetical protein